MGLKGLSADVPDDDRGDRDDRLVDLHCSCVSIIGYDSWSYF